MPITNRNLEPGTKLIATYKKETHHALVVAGEDGKPRYQLVPYDGQEYKSPSSLGTAVTGKSCNGWAFWSVDTGEAQPESESTTAQETPAAADAVSGEQAPEEETPPEDATGQDTTEPEDQQEAGSEPTVTAAFRRVPNQRGLDEGEVRLYCNACKQSFVAPVGQQPDTCPQGHWPDDAGAPGSTEN